MIPDISIANRIAVLGAGRMGMSLAGYFCRKGIPIALYSRRLENHPKVLSELKPAIRKGKFNDQGIAVPVHITAEISDPVIKCAALIIESQEEEYDQKNQTFLHFKDNVSGQIVATNTSSLDINRIAKVSGCNQLIGLHFFYPVSLTKIVEMIFPSGTEKYKETVSQLLHSLGLLTLEVKNTPAFFINRIMIRYFLSACDLLKQGTKYIAVDQMMINAGCFSGPFEMVDRVGLDLTLNVLTMMSQNNAKFYVPEVLSEKVSKKHFGQRSGKGFYNYASSKSQEYTNQNVDISHVVESIKDEVKCCLSENIVINGNVEDALIAVLGNMGSTIINELKQ